MGVLINTKICDNAKECSGIEACPTNAMYWDESLENIVVDQTKCTSCKLCVPECPVGAIKVFETDDEYKTMVLEIDNDQRKPEDLFVERYGGAPIDEDAVLEYDSFVEKIDSFSNLTFVELFTDDSIQCLLHSIPFHDIILKFSKCNTFYKVECAELGDNRFDVANFPALFIFDGSQFLGKIEGYFEDSQLDSFIKKIKLILPEEQ